MIPAFNAERYLDRALRSVFDQRHVADQIIVVDDGSSDRTAEIAGRYAPAVTLHRQTNGGAAAARNLGISHAQQDFVAFLDADDEWLPHHLEQAAELLIRHPGVDWYSAACQKMERTGLLHDQPSPERVLENGCIRSYLEASASWINYTPTMLVRRAVLEDVGCFDTSLPTAEDLDLWFRIALTRPRMAFGSRAAVIVHHTPGSLTTQGRFTRERAERLINKWEGLADASGRACDPLVRAYMLKVISDLLRAALVRVDRSSVEWVGERFASELPPLWRAASMLCLGAPEPLWRSAAAAWLLFRSAREGSQRITERRL